MNRYFWRIGFAVVLPTALFGCKKELPQPDAPTFFGVRVDLPRLDTQFGQVSQDAAVNIAVIKRDFRYSQFMQAMMELDKLANDPSLNEAQKKVVAELLEQTKQVIAKAPAQPGQ
jgi:hypothetical protein